MNMDEASLTYKANLIPVSYRSKQFSHSILAHKEQNFKSYVKFIIKKKIKHQLNMWLPKNSMRSMKLHTSTYITQVKSCIITYYKITSNYRFYCVCENAPKVVLIKN